MTFATTGVFIFRWAKGEMRSSDWEREPVTALLLGPGYKPAIAHRLRDAIKFELSTDGYERQALRSRKAVLDVDSEAIQLKAADLSWQALGPRVGGPVVAGLLVARVTPETDNPIAYYRLEPVQLNGQPYSLSLEPNKGVLLEIA